jgi:hypothetical protein
VPKGARILVDDALSLKKVGNAPRFDAQCLGRGMMIGGWSWDWQRVRPFGSLARVK